MPTRRRPVLAAAGLALALLSGCTTDDAANRRPGDPVTREEAGALAELLHRNRERGGADFAVTAPYGDDVVRTLTFTSEEMWFDVPGLAEALARAGEPTAVYLRRPTTAGTDDRVPLLVDVLVEIVLDLSSPTADDPRAFLTDGYTWEGQRSIDSRLTSLFGLHDGRTVAVAASGDLLAQFVTPLAGEDLDVTVTLSGHGPRTLTVPGEEETADAAEHPDIAASLGI